ncbi:MAG: hypothetical protein GVY16_11985 [Planctomycetes bacterium]|jgi:hypothetical protein|nr:hypothetical protein [Planctomycetota bacterium]
MTLHKIGKKKRKLSLRPGDVFAYSIDERDFHFGRVVSTDFTLGPWIECLLLYLYNASSDDPQRVPVLSKDDLLIPPIVASDGLFRKGYLIVVDHEPLTNDEVFSRHCFKDVLVEGRFYDDSGAKVRRFEPCGEWALKTDQGLDKTLGQAIADATE